MRLHELRVLIDERCAAGHEMDRVKVLIIEGGRELVFTPDELLSPLKWDPTIYLTVEESLDVD